MKRTYNFKRSGFTLIEILVVIGIIALLAAILFPVLSKARENARRTSCLSNMKQLGMAFQQYVQDAGRRYPGAGQYQKWNKGGHWVAAPEGVTGATGKGGKLAEDTSPFTPSGDSADLEAGSLYPYVRSEAVYHCPSVPGGAEKKLSYSMNCAIAGMNDVRMRNPTEVILLVDEAHNNDGFFYTNSKESTDAITNIHNGAGNLLLADGHVKSYTHGQYPLVSSKDGTTDGNTAAQKLKTSDDSVPRFYDRAFGPKAYYVSPFGSCITPG